MLFGTLGRCAEATAPETQEQALGSPRTLPARLRGVGAVSVKSKHLFRGRGPFLCHSGEENCASGGQEREWGLAEGWPAGKAGGPAPPSWRGAAWSGGWGGTGSQLTARPIREKRGFVSHSVSRSASSLGSVSRLPGPGHLRALLSTPPLGQRPPAGGGKDTARPFLSLLLAHLPLDPRRPLWWGASASPVLVQAWRWAGGSFRAGRGRVLGRGPGGALLPPRGEVRTACRALRRPQALQAGVRKARWGRPASSPGSSSVRTPGAGGRRPVTVGPRGARAALRGSHLRPSRAVPRLGAHGVDSAGLPGGWSTTRLGVLCFRVSFLRPGLGPGSLKAPQGREGGSESTGVRLGGTRRGREGGQEQVSEGAPGGRGGEGEGAA